MRSNLGPAACRRGFRTPSMTTRSAPRTQLLDQAAIKRALRKHRQAIRIPALLVEADPPGCRADGPGSMKQLGRTADGAGDARRPGIAKKKLNIIKKRSASTIAPQTRSAEKVGRSPKLMMDGHRRPPDRRWPPKTERPAPGGSI